MIKTPAYWAFAIPAAILFAVGWFAVELVHLPAQWAYALGAFYVATLDPLMHRAMASGRKTDPVEVPDDA